jgi:hypothetical protein
MQSQHAKEEKLPPTSENVDFGAQNMFTIACIMGLYASPFAQGFSDQQCQAAIRALLRQGTHANGAHYHTQTQGGLHPAYVAFNPIEKSDTTTGKVFHKSELIEASIGDVFDVVRSHFLVFHDS